jgi:hypothetical protein
MDFQTLINQRVNDKVQTLEVYGDEVEEKIYLEATIHEPVVNFVTDVDCNRFRFPNTLRVIDIDAFVPNLNLDFNIPDSTEQIIIREKNIIHKNLMELFPEHIKYKYTECNLNGMRLNILINKLYKKYFNIESQLNKEFNIIYSDYNKSILDEIRNYETRVTQGKQFCKIIKETLVAAVWHPDRVEKWLHTGIELDDL